jgi:hypothetical protein
VGDGSTQGGQLLSANLIDDENPFLGGDLNLNNNKIVGQGNINITGNIDIDGYINATGNINLGDGAEDNIIVGGNIESSLIPGQDGTYDLGDSTSKWRSGFFEGISVDGEISANSLSVNNIYNTDSSIIYNASTNQFTADIIGSVLAEDSGVIIDTSTGDINASDIFAQSINAEEIFSILEGDVRSLSGTKAYDYEAELFQGQRLDLSNLDTSKISLRKKNTNIDLSTSIDDRGQINFERNDINGIKTEAFIAGGPDAIYAVIDDGTLSYPETNALVFKEGGNLGVGTFNPSNKLDVNGNANINGTILVSGWIQFGSYDNTQIASITPQNGMVYYNTTEQRFRGYQNGQWINLDDGTLA